MAAINAFLRGVQISPEANQSTHYYLCLVDLPSSFDPNLVSIVPPTEGDTNLNYSYIGDLSKLSGSNTTFMLPVYTDQSIAQTTNFVIITDNSASKNTITGNPNHIKPPIVEFIERAIPYTCSVLNYQSSTVPGSFFVVILVNTVNKGFSNELLVTPQSLSTGPTLTTNLQGTFAALPLGSSQPGANHPVVAIGAYQSTAFQYQSAYVSYVDSGSSGYTNGPLTPIIYLSL